MYSVGEEHLSVGCGKDGRLLDIGIVERAVREGAQGIEDRTWSEDRGGKGVDGDDPSRSQTRTNRPQPYAGRDGEWLLGLTNAPFFQWYRWFRGTVQGQTGKSREQ